ncbi:unnamed protein product [Macrosiphum euphorbiae]|uniref:Uncharacterized protein n=1 Tax=Macrosiphum euphorbiae TaxID=13131 RepID=A0AAV0W9E9_9HEMI|nr:unnamed protein product [Macrosiphum euphorbiae]
MDRNSRIYNFGPDGRDACWAALSSSWGRCSNQQGSYNSRSVNSCRSSKKTSVFKTSLSPRPQPPPLSSPRVIKRKSSVQQPTILTNNRLSSSGEVMKVTILEPPSSNDQCNCSQSGYSELPVVNGVTSNNNNNNDNDKNNQKYEVLETIDFVNQKQQQLVCVADSGSSIDITEPPTVYAEKPMLVLQNECDDTILSVSSPPTPSTANKQPIESAKQIEGDKVSSMSCPLTLSNTVEQSIESSNQIEGDNVSSLSCPLTLSNTVEQQIEMVQQIDGDNVSSVSCPLTLSNTVEQQIEMVQQIDGDKVSSLSCPLTLSNTVEQPFESSKQIECEYVSSISCPLTLSTTTEQQIERVQQIEGENVSSVPCPVTMSIAIEQQIESEPQIKSDPVISISSLLSLSIVVEQPVVRKLMAEVVVANHNKVSPVLSPQLPLMTSTTYEENPIVLKVVSPSPQPKDGNGCPVQSNTGMMVLSDKPALSNYEMKIKEIDNKLISYSKSILCTVLVVVLLRVLF